MLDDEIKREEIEDTEEKVDNKEAGDLEFEFSEDGEDNLKKKIKDIREDLRKCQIEKTEYLTGWQKERADFVNYKKQEDARKIEYLKFTKANLLTGFLDVIDSFDLAFANKESLDKVDKDWRNGIEYIYNQFNSALSEYGVETLGNIGETFDPAIHQSMATIKTDEKEKDQKVVDIVQKGYKLGEHVLRPAKVNIFEYLNN